MRNIGKNNIRKRALALLMAVVMIISLLISGGSSSLDFVNAEGEQDLSSFTNSVSYNLPPGGSEGVYAYKTGSTYSFNINFTEIASGDGIRQFANDSYTFTYTLPEQLSVADFSGTEDIPITGTEYGDVTFYGCEYTITNGVLRLVVKFDNVKSPSTDLTSDQAKNLFDTTPNIHFGLNFDGVVKSGSTQINFGGDTNIIMLEEDSSKNIKTNKSASAFNPQTGEVTYTLTLTSEGENNNVSINDTFGSNSFTIDSSSIVVSSNKSSSKTINNQNVTGNTLSGQLDLGNNEVVTISYKAKYNGSLSASSSDGSSIYYGSETDRTNSFSVTPSDNITTVNDTPDTSDDTVTAITSIKYPKINKSANGTTVDEVTKKGSITWTITAFSFPGNSLSGKTITDVFGDNFDTATFDLSNVVITKQQINYESEYYQSNVGEPENVSNTNITSSATGWTFTVPDESRTNGNECYKYTITYTTPVDASEKTSDYNITNTVSSSISSSDSSTISPGVQMPAEPDSSKNYEYLGNNQVRWTITLDIPVSGISSDSEVSVIDTLPSISTFWDSKNNQWVNVGPYKDYIVNGANGITVDYSSKIEGESSDVSLTDDGFKVLFTKKDGDNTVPGFASNSAGTRRTVTISYVTELNSDWLALMNQRTDISGLREHKNSSVFNTGNNSYTKDATYKADYTVARSIDKSFVSGYAANGSQGTTGTTDSQGNTIDDLPYFRYQIDLEGIDDSSFDSNGNLIIEDSFDENLAYFYSNYYEVGFGGVEDWGGINSRITPTIDTSQSGKVSFTISKNSIPKKSGAYYSKYRMIYFLRIKDKTAESNIAQTAVNSNNQKATLSNTASVDGFGTDDASFDYSYDAVQKSSTGYSSSNRTATFTVTLNPDGVDMDPSKDTIDVTDTYSQNLSIDYNAIHATIDGTPDLESPNNLVHYYASGNVLHLIVPDGKKVVITYDAKAIGFGSLTLTNTVNFYKQDETWSQDVTYTESSSSGGSQASITIFKYEDGDMTVPLPNVVFRLYKKSDDSFIKEFTTDSDGKFTIYSADGINYDVPYYVKEISGAPEGYNMSNVNWTFTLVEKLEDVNYSFGVWKYYSGDTLTVSNETTNMSIPVYKKWVGTAGTEAKFELYKMVEGVETKVSGVPTLTLNSSNNWAGSFNDIPRRDSNGNEIQYIVKEIDVPAGYVSDGGIRIDDTGYSRIDKGVNFTNTELSNGTLIITKEVVNGNSSNANDVYSVNVVAQGNETVLDTNSIVVSGADSYTVASDTEKKTVSFTFQKNDTVTISGLPYDDYAITEEAGSYTTTYSVDSAAESSTAQVSLSSEDKTSSINIINTYERQKGKLIINKSFKDESNINYPTDHNNVLFIVKITLKDGIEPLVGTKNFGEIEFNNGIAYVNVSGNNNVIIEDIPYDYTYQIEEQEPSTNGYSIVSGTGNGTIDTDEVTETIINTTVGDLEVSKTLVSDLSSDADVDFNFTVTLGDTSINGTYGDMDFSDGVATFSLKGGEVATAEGLPSGITYDVVEASNAAFTTAKTGDTGTIPSIDTATAAFTNTRKTGDLEVSKELVSSTAGDEDINFSFRVTLTDTTINGSYGDMEFNNGVAEFTLKGGESKSAVGLPQSVGYTVTETADDRFTTTSTGETGTIPYTEAEVVFTNTRNNTPVQTGSFDITKVINDTGYDSSTEFPITVTLTYPNGVAVSGKYRINNGTYTDITGTSPVSIGTSSNPLTIKTTDTIHFEDLPYGTTYSVSENIPAGVISQGYTLKSISYGSTSNSNGTISASTNDNVTITNNYKKDGKIYLRKYLTGRNWDEIKSLIKFTVYKIDENDNNVKFIEVLGTADGWTYNDTTQEPYYEYVISGLEYTKYKMVEEISGDTNISDYISFHNAVVEFPNSLTTSNRGFETHDFNLIYDADNTSLNSVICKFYNEYFAKSIDLKIKKTGEDSDSSGLGGAGFTLYSDEDCTQVAQSEEITDSNNNYTVTFTGLKPGTDYWYKETTTPNGYIANTTPVKITTTPSDQIPDDTRYIVTEMNATVTNKKTIVKVSKVDVTNDKELPGATIQILDKDGNVVDEWTSTSVPHEIVGLNIEETYTLKETVAPSGYQLTTETTFTLDKFGNIDSSKTTTNQNSAGVLLVEDWPQGSVVVNKRGLLNETCTDYANEAVQLKDVEFTLTKKGDSSFSAVTATTNDNGVAVFDKLDAGTYEIKETKTVDGYNLDTNTYIAEIDIHGNYSGLKDSDGNAIEGNMLTNDLYRTDIEFTKVNLDNSNQKLPGSTYGLFARRSALGTRRGSLLAGIEGTQNITEANKNDLIEIARATTNSKGLVRFAGVLPGVEYTVKELIAPNGFYVSENPISLTYKVDDNGNVVLASLDTGDSTIKVDVNGNITWLEPEVKVSFLKTDESGKPLAGAKLKVVDKDGKDVMSWTSKEEAYTVIGTFTCGETYKLIEVSAPDGYQVAEAVSFTIPGEVGSKGLKPISVVMADKKLPDTSTSTPSKESTPETTVTSAGTSVDTGDPVPVILITIMLFVALLGCAVTIFLKKKVFI